MSGHFTAKAHGETRPGNDLRRSYRFEVSPAGSGPFFGYILHACRGTPFARPIASQAVPSMLSIRRIVLILFVLALPAAAPAQTVTWTIDPGHSAATFQVRHMVVA